MIKEYQNSLGRTLAGMIFGLSDHNLSEAQVTAVGRILNKLKLEDYMDLSSKVSEEKWDKVESTLRKIGVKEFKGFPTMKESRTTPSRNPMATHARRRRHGIEDPKKKTDQKDPWARGAKHKDDKMKKVEESVLGMANVPMVTRMRELAGIKAPVAPVSEKLQKLRHIRELEDFDDIQSFDDSLDAETGVDPMGGPVAPATGTGFPQADLLAAAGDDFGGDDFGDDLGSGMDNGMGVDPMDAPMDDGLDGDDLGMDAPMDGDDLGIPSFSSTLPGAVPAPVVDNTPAYSQIMSSLDQITAQLKDVKVSEYKEIINRLKSVHQEIRNQGFNYLQENRKRKK